MIQNQFVVRIYLYLKYSVKGALKHKYGFYVINIMTKMIIINVFSHNATCPYLLIMSNMTNVTREHVHYD
jgi:hypothetical protein